MWKGNEEWVYGRVVSRMKITKWTGQQEKDENGNWVWTNAKCGIDSKELKKPTSIAETRRKANAKRKFSCEAIELCAYERLFPLFWQSWFWRLH